VTSKETFRAPKGTRDILPPQSLRQRALTDLFAEMAGRYGFGEVVSPMFEDLGVFQRIGEGTDVVKKEMFELVSRSGDTQLALRPELTASVCRAFAQHRPPTPWKVFYQGPQFRYERPQAGRYRQFTQVGAEALGSDDPLLDVEIIALASRFFQALGLTQVRLLLNSLGDPEGRPAYLVALTEYFEANAESLSIQSQTTLQTNPLRVLDSKRPEDAAVIDGAPLITDFLSDSAAEHFAAVCAGLDQLGIDYEIAPRLVRGLDYYLRTTFEFAADALDAAQNAVGGGGRYDGLVEQLGGPATPGIGFALGVDRILMACDAEGVFPGPPAAADVFLVDLTDGTQSLALLDELARGGVRVDRAYDNRSVKAQFKAADRSEAPLAVIIGEDEVAAGTAQIKDLVTGDQRSVTRSELLVEIRKLCS
jgi:histidyl-tRNA synthetase